MSLTPGTRLGPYEILAPLGSGGMGEVFRARDARLGREVAVKVLPDAVTRDAERMRRFELEARAAGRLDHPNILAVHDVGLHEGVPYVVTELLEGKTLRERLSEGTPPQRKSLEWALGVAHGLGAAHEKGVLHRDIKPENLFVTSDGRIKILDFGLAKLEAPVAPIDEGKAPTVAIATSPGEVLGTIGYMSPEQVRGEAADARSDIFSFGAVLWEMLSGRRAFQAGSPVETMNAILHDDPPDLMTLRREISPVLSRVVHRCLEKVPGERFQSMRDAGFALQAVASTIDSDGSQRAITPSSPSPRRRPPARLLLVTAVGLALAAGLAIGLSLRRAEPLPSSHPTLTAALPSFQQLTFRSGTVYTARFSPDNRTVVYSAAWDGRPKELFSTSIETRDARPLGLPRHDVVGVSGRGEIAVIIRPDDGFSPGTLARVPLAGGPARRILDGVISADWSSDRDELCVVRAEKGKYVLEYPIGRTLLETASFINYPRIAPSGEQVAFLEHPRPIDDAGSLALADRKGSRTTLSEGWGSIEGVGWSPDGGEVWFTAARRGIAASLWAVRPGSKERLLARAPGRLVLHDVSRDGHALAEENSLRYFIRGFSPADEKEIDLSWLDLGVVADISSDGRALLFTESGNGTGGSQQVYLRQTDGSLPVRLVGGQALALSPDGASVLVRPQGEPSGLSLVPTGVGVARSMPAPGLNVHAGGFFPDGRRIWLLASEEGHGARLYIQPLDGSTRRVVSPEGTARGHPVSPDGRWLFARVEEKVEILAVDGSERRPVPGLGPTDVPLAWTPDGKGLLIREAGMPVHLWRLDLSTGHKTPLRDLVPPDPAGVLGVGSVVVQCDGRLFAYTYGRLLSDLHVISDLNR